MTTYLIALFLSLVFTGLMSYIMIVTFSIYHIAKSLGKIEIYLRPPDGYVLSVPQYPSYSESLPHKSNKMQKERKNNVIA